MVYNKAPACLYFQGVHKKCSNIGIVLGYDAQRFGRIGKNTSIVMQMLNPRQRAAVQTASAPQTAEIDSVYTPDLLSDLHAIDMESAKASPLSDIPGDDIEKEEEWINDAFSSEAENTRPEGGLYGRGLFQYKLWWYREWVDIRVDGELITGIPVFTDCNTLRVINGEYSYFIPVEKISYIRTTDGFQSTV